MSTEPKVYYLSDPAFNRLIGMAQRQGYVRFGTNKAKGLSEFLNDLSRCPFEDTRPPLVIQRHAEEERNNRAPTWSSFRQRRQRLLKLSDDAIARYFYLAEQVGITRESNFAIGGPNRRTPYPSVAYFLEGIGLEWLTPSDVPRKVL